MDNPLDQVIPRLRKPILGWPPGNMDIFIICRIKFHMPMEIPWFMSYEPSTNTPKQALTQFMELHLAATLPMKIRCKWKERKGLIMCTHGMVPWYRENPFLWKIDNLILWKMWKDFGTTLIRWSRSLKKICVSHPILFYVAMIWRKNTMFVGRKTKKVQCVVSFYNPLTCLWTTRTYELIMAISKEES